jgi:3-deoxy-manno-octulosonate cytidylyltransferase (CMP-KDO synthetase)
VERVYTAAVACPHLERVVVATDDEGVADCVRAFGGAVEMTSSDHRSGTDRVAEVAERHPESDVVVNVQGDQPFVSADQLTALLGPYLAGETPQMTTLACPLGEGLDAADPGVVTVVRDRRGRALYFSRSPIPYGDGPRLHHLGLYAFHRDALKEYTALPETELEVRERLEQLRALEHGFEIMVCLTDEAVLEVNTPADLERARAAVVGAPRG